MNEVLDRKWALELVTDMETQTGIDKFLIYAIIEVESARKIQAKSSSGAYGLMQLKNIVVDDVNKYFDTKYKYSDIENPVLNIKIGALYLRRWVNTFIEQGYPEYLSIFYAILTYGWGYGNMQKWFNSQASNEKILEGIPQEKTHYNEKVMWWYNKLREIHKK